MKHLILFLLACFIISGMVFSQEMKTPNELLIGKWKNANNMVYEFTADRKILVNEKEYATFIFSEGELILSYMGSDITFGAGLEFVDENHMRLTEYKDRGDEAITMLFKRLQE